MRVRQQRCGGLILAAAVAMACAAGPGEPAAAAPAATQQAVTAAAPTAQPTADIRHLVPAPDSVGPAPTRFEWTAVEGADSYWLRIWTEVDVRLLSEDGLRATSLDLPADAEFAPGTYFWSVVARRGDRAVAESGLAAFVVMQ